MEHELSSWIYPNASSTTQGCQATTTTERGGVEDSTEVGLLDLGFAIDDASAINLDKNTLAHEDATKKESSGTAESWIDQVIRFSELKIFLG